MMNPDESFGESMMRLPASAELEEAEREFQLRKYAPKPNLTQVAKDYESKVRQSTREVFTDIENVSVGEPSVHLRPVAKERLQDPEVGKPFDTDVVDVPLQEGLAVDITSGVVKGAANMAQGIWNIVNAVDDIAFGNLVTSHTGGKGAIDPTNFADGIDIDENSLAANAAMHITEMAAPFGLGFKGASALGTSSPSLKFLAGVAVDAGVSTMLTDPKRGGLLDTFVRKYPDSKPLLANLLVDDDTSYGAAASKRFAESLLLGASAGKAIDGVGKVVRGARKAHKAKAEALEAQRVPKQTITAKDVLDEETMAMYKEYRDTINYVRDSSTYLPKGKEVTSKSFIEANKNLTFEELAQFEANRRKVAKNLASKVTNPEDTTDIALSSIIGTSDINQESLALAIISEIQDGITTGSIARKSLTEMDAIGLEYLKNNKEDFAKLIANYKPGDSLTYEQGLATVLYTRSAIRKLEQLYDKVLAYRHIPAEELGPRQLYWIAQADLARDAFMTAAPMLVGDSRMLGQRLRYLQHDSQEAVDKMMKTAGALREYVHLAGVDKVMKEAEMFQEAFKSHGETMGIKLMHKLSATTIDATYDMAKALSELIYSGMMTGTRTFSKAFLGGAVMNVKENLDKAMGLMAGKFLPQRLGGMSASEFEMYRAAFMARMYASNTAKLAAYENVYNSITQGKSSYSGIIDEDVLRDSITRWQDFQGTGNFFVDSLAKFTGSFLRTANAARDYSTRLLRSADAFHGSIAAHQTYAEYATYEGWKAGLRGDELASYVHWHTLNPTKELIEKGEKAGRRAAFAADYTDLIPSLGKSDVGIVGGALEAIDRKVLSTIPFAKSAVPLLKTNVNSLVTGIENTPGVQMISPRLLKALNSNGPEKYEAIGKIANAWAFTSSIVGLQQMGYLEISGDIPKDKALYAALKSRNPGWQPKSIRLGDKWVSYADIPGFGPMLHALHTYQEYSSKNDINPEDYTMVSGILAAAAEQFDLRTLTYEAPNFLSLISEIMTSDPAGKEKAMNTFAKSFSARLLPMSGIAREITQGSDNIERSRYAGDVGAFGTLIHEWKRIIPGLSHGLMPNRNIFGEIILNPTYLGMHYGSPFMVSDVQDDPVNEELMRLGLWNEALSGEKGDGSLPIRMPPKSLTFDLQQLGTLEFKLTPEEYDRLIQYSAGIIPKERLAAMPTREDFSGAAGSDSDMKLLYGNYHERIKGIQSAAGGLMPLKEVLRKVLLTRSYPPAGISKEDKEQYNLTEDNVIRTQVKQTINAYQALGQAFLFQERMTLDRVKTEAEIREQILNRSRRWQ
jgi:hypothetical protein